MQWKKLINAMCPDSRSAHSLKLHCRRPIIYVLFSPPLPLNGTYLVLPPPKVVACSETKMIKYQLKLVPEDRAVEDLWFRGGSSGSTADLHCFDMSLLYRVHHHANSPVQCARLTWASCTMWFCDSYWTTLYGNITPTSCVTSLAHDCYMRHCRSLLYFSTH